MPSAIALEHRPEEPELPMALGEEAGDREDEQELPELGRLELERADVDPALRAAHRLRERVDDHHQRERGSVDDAPVTPVQRRRDRDRDDEPDRAERGRDRLPHDEVVRVARDVEARDPCDRPEPVADEGAGREQEDEIEPADERAEVDGVARAQRDPLASGVDDHRAFLISRSSPGSGSRPSRRRTSRRPAGRRAQPRSSRGRRSRSRRR